MNGGENQYEQMTGDQSTPIKLYSPFTIETPPILIKPEERQRLRQQLFTSPRNQLRNDIENLQSRIEHLNLMAKNIVPNQYRQTNHHDDDNENERQSSVEKSSKRLIMFQSEESLI